MQVQRYPVLISGADSEPLHAGDVDELAKRIAEKILPECSSSLLSIMISSFEKNGVVVQSRLSSAANFRLTVRVDLQTGGEIGSGSAQYCEGELPEIK